jgi:molybdate transport system regulatory protein
LISIAAERFFVIVHLVYAAMRYHKGKLHYAFRLYLVSDGNRLIGKGGAQILNAIDRLGSISASAKELGMSYRFVWLYIRRMETRLGKAMIVTRRGGTRRRTLKGGGGAKLTPVAKELLKDYNATEARLRKQLS